MHLWDVWMKQHCSAPCTPCLQALLQAHKVSLEVHPNISTQQCPSLQSSPSPPCCARAMCRVALCRQSDHRVLLPPGSMGVFCFGLLVGSGCKLQGCLMLCSDGKWEAGRGLWAVGAAIMDISLPPGSRSARDPLSPVPAPGGRRCPTSPRTPAAQVRSFVPTPMGSGGRNQRGWKQPILAEHLADGAGCSVC